MPRRGLGPTPGNGVGPVGVANTQCSAARREILLLCDGEGRSAAEVSDTLGATALIVEGASHAIVRGICFVASALSQEPPVDFESVEIALVVFTNVLNGAVVDCQMKGVVPMNGSKCGVRVEAVVGLETSVVVEGNWFTRLRFPG